MADLSKLVEYDKAIPVNLIAPDGSKTEITFNVVSADSKRVADVTRKIDNERWLEVFASDDKKLSPEQIARFADKAEREAIIAAIESWEWGSDSWGHINAESPCNEENKRFLIEHPNAKWIRDNISAKVADLTNFTQPSKKPARATSRK